MDVLNLTLGHKLHSAPLSTFSIWNANHVNLFSEETLVK